MVPGGPTPILNVSLENVDDVKGDLDRGLAALKAG